MCKGRAQRPKDKVCKGHGVQRTKGPSEKNFELALSRMRFCLKGRFLYAAKTPLSVSVLNILTTVATMFCVQFGPLTTRHLLSWSFQIAKGMEYLSAKKVSFAHLLSSSRYSNSKIRL